MEEKNISLTALDQLVSDDKSQLIKAAIPYLPQSGQQIFSIFTKARELSNAITLFSQSPGSMQAQSITQQHSPLTILKDISGYCYGESLEQIQQILRLISIFQLVQSMNIMSEETSEEQGESS